jgi:hypothetical protein
MLIVGQRIHDVQPRRRGGEFREHTLGERADDHRCHPPLEVSRDVGDGFAAAERGLRIQLEHVPADLADGDGERRMRAQRGFFEEHRHMTPAEYAGGRCVAPERTVGFHPGCELEAAFEVGRLEIEHGEKILAGDAAGLAHHRTRQVLYSALIRIYSALRSQVHTVDDDVPVPRSTDTAMSSFFR